MGITIKDDKLVSDYQDMDKGNYVKILRLNDNSYFSNNSMNYWGRQLFLYLTNSVYGEMLNPDPADVTKNTVSKVLQHLRVIDMHIQKPLSDYTAKDMNKFIADFLEGKVKSSNPNKAIQPHTLRRYIMEFKRLMTVYKHFHYFNKKKLDLMSLSWVETLKAPRNRRMKYEKYSERSIKEIKQLANSLAKEEYSVRVMFSVGLMGRKCEVNEITRDRIIIKGNEVTVELPDIKKNSTEKVPVELYTFVKKPLLNYLDKHDFKPRDKIFPSKDTAFNKNLKEVSERLFNERITAKTLRKLGVCVAEELQISKADVERIGGWKNNSPVLNHYYSRQKVSVNKSIDRKIESQANPDMEIEMQKMKQEMKKMQEHIFAINNTKLRE